MELTELYQITRDRTRPEDAAALCLRILDDKLSHSERKLLEKAARGSLGKRLFGGYTSMAQTFKKPIGAAEQMETPRRLFPDIAAPADPDNPAQLEIYLQQLNAAIGKTFGYHDFAAGRLSHDARRELGLEVSRRQYNKMFRCIAHLEEKLKTLKREADKYEFTRVGKSKLATRIPLEEWQKDADSSCFIAYYAARCNLRSTFTNQGQVRPFDEICEMLLARCRPGKANWWAIAHVHPDADVLKHLSDEQKGLLLARWFEQLSEIGALLREVWQASDFARDTMIVRRGNDSTTWNNTAAAWNKARDSWINTLDSLQMNDLLDAVCPGKVPRLMAADVVSWHLSSGGALHHDTQIWSALPLPWEVLDGEAQCGRDRVEAACRAVGVDPLKTGWSAPRPRGRAALFTPTPELVHGVEVGHPVLAKILRDAGFFSGKAKSSPAAKAALN